MGVGTGGVSSFLYTGVSGLGVSLPNGLSIPFPTLDLDFANTNSLDTRITFTRASNATYFDSSGVLQTAGNNVARFDHNPTTLQSLGLLIEEQRTNSIRNNTMQGAVAGTPGTSPTNWAIGAIGLSSTIVGTGTENGITYVDIRVFGTTTSQFGSILFETTTGIVASASQSWTNSIYLKLVAGTVNGLSQVGVGTYYYNSTPTFLTNSTAQVTLTSTLTRYTLTATTPATTAYIRPLFYFNGANASGDAVDFTLRIGLPQLERGAFATSVIPTTTAAATRNADVASMTGTNFSSWYNATEGTLYSDNFLFQATGFKMVCEGAGGGTFRDFSLQFDGTRPNFTARYQTGNFDVSGPVGASNVFYKLAASYTSSSADLAFNGTLATTKSSITQRVPADSMFIGSRIGGLLFLNGHIRRIAYYPVRLSNDQLQALTR